LEATALSSRFIHEMMQSSSARRQVLILDCCFSGAFPRGFTFKAAESIDSGHYFEAKGSGQLILTACDEMQYAFEGDDLIEKNVTCSVFTGVLIDGFRTGNADVDQDGQISFKDIYEYAIAEMRSRGSSQVPQKWHFGLDDLILANNPDQRVKEFVEELNIRTESPDPEVRLQAAYDLGDLARTSGGRRALAARQGLKKLVTDDSRAVSDFAKATLEALGAPPGSLQPPVRPRRQLTVVVVVGAALIFFSSILVLIRFSDLSRIWVVTPAHTVVPSPPVVTPTPAPSESVTPSPPPDPFVHAIHVVELGLDVAFVAPQQTQSVLGAMPGAQVIEVESGGAAEKAGIKVGDIIEAIGKQKIDTLDNMRKSLRELGSGKTQFTIRRSNTRITILVDCPNC
jgi:hypothetical protein